MEHLEAKKINLGLDQIQKWTGLRPEDIDHLALGLRPNEALKGFTLVVRTRQPYAESTIAEAVKPAVPPPAPNAST